MNNTDNFWFPNPKYQKMKYLGKRRLCLNQQNQKKSSDCSESKDPTYVNAVSIKMISQMSKMSTSITSLATHVKNQDNRLKRLMLTQMVDSSDSDELFISSDGELEGKNSNNGSLVRGWLKSYKRGRNKWHVRIPPKSFAVCDMKTVWLCPRSANVSTVATNSNKTALEDDSHADNTCLEGDNP